MITGQRPSVSSGNEQVCPVLGTSCERSLLEEGGDAQRSDEQGLLPRLLRQPLRVGGPPGGDEAEQQR